MGTRSIVLSHFSTERRTPTRQIAARPASAGNQMRVVCRLTLLLLLGVLAANSGCGGGGSSGPAPPQGYTVGGSVNGLTAAGLMLANGSDTVSVPANTTSFTLPSLLATGTSYAVTVKTQPSQMICSVSMGSGTMGGSAVTNVAVNCLAVACTAGGTIQGTQTVIASAFNGAGIAADAAGDVYVAAGVGSPGTELEFAL